MSLTYNKSGDTITITVQDPTYRKTGSWKFNTADKELGAGILRHIQRKYGFSPEIKPGEGVNEIQQDKKQIEKEDADWLNLQTNW